MLPSDVFIYVTVFLCLFHCEFLPKCHALNLMAFDRHTTNVMRHRSAVVESALNQLLSLLVILYK